MKNPIFVTTFDPTKEKALKPNIAAKRLQCHRQTVYKLAAAGFLRSFRPSPQTVLVSESSVAEYAATQVGDPEFWDRPENLERYKNANGYPVKGPVPDEKTTRKRLAAQAN
jgi:excisionase family DNA binding protein